MDYKQKYIKYKNKYLELKNLKNCYLTKPEFEQIVRFDI